MQGPHPDSSMTAPSISSVPPHPRSRGRMVAGVGASLTIHALLAAAILTTPPRPRQSATAPYLPITAREIILPPRSHSRPPAVEPPPPPVSPALAAPPPTPRLAEPQRRQDEHRPPRRATVAVAKGPIGAVAVASEGNIAAGGLDSPSAAAAAGAEASPLAPPQNLPLTETALPPTRPTGCPGGMAWALKLPPLLGNCLDRWGGVPRPCGAATVLRLTVAANGVWLGPPAVVATCGDGLADRQVQAAVAECAPLPRLPAACRAVEVDVPVRFAEYP